MVGDLTNEKMTLKEELEKANELIKLKEVQQEGLPTLWLAYLVSLTGLLADPFSLLDWLIS